MKRYKNVPYIILAFYGLLVYSISNTISMNSFFGYVLKLATIIFILMVLIASPKYNKEGRMTRIITVFVIYTIFIIVRGTFIGRLPVDAGREMATIHGIAQVFFWSQYSALSFIVILFILVPFDPKELGYYRTLAYICTAICLFGVLRYKDYLFDFTVYGETGLSINGRELSIRNLIAASFIGFGAVMLYAFNYNTFRKSIIDCLPLLVLVLYFVSYVASGGRGGSINAFFYCLVALYFYARGTKDRTKRKPFHFVMALGIIVAAIYGIRYMYSIGYFDFLFFRLFEGGEFGGELNESSRETYLGNLIDYLNNHPIAWAFGRGVNGYYITSSGFRPTIETGYWYLILKGGIIYLVLYIYILLKAAYIGFFKSKNQFVKTLGAVCLLRAYLLIPFGLPEVSLDFVLAFHCVRLINSDYLRDLTDDEVRALLLQKNKT